MFSRDSKFSRDSQHPRNQAVPRDSNLPHTKLPQKLPQTNLTASERATIASDAPALSVERSQSWQIAPNLFTSFKYAWAGISYAFTTQRNFRIHTGVGIVAGLLCWTLKVGTVSSAIICLTIGAVLVMEILNTALESLVDLTVGQTYHELAKIAKDCAAGAVLMSAIVAMIIAILIFAPPAWALITPLFTAG